MRDTDRGFKALRRLLVGLQSARVLVGVRAEKGGQRGRRRGKTDRLNLAQIAAVNEFGSSDGRVPERSFLRSTVDENRERYADVIERQAGAAIDAATSSRAVPSLDVVLGRVGAVAKGDVQRKIASSVPPPNAASTIERKGSSTTLIDTGRLRQSIDWEIDDGSEG